MFKYYISFLFIILFSWSGYYVAHNGYYPVAIVNYKIITSKHWQEASVSAFNYYSKLKNPKVDDSAFQKEINRATLDQLIENQLVYEDVSQTEVDKQVASLINQNQNLEKGAQALYGLSLISFQDLVLKPQVATELLQKKLQDNHQDFNAWLKKKKSIANVFIFATGLAWNGEKIIVK